VPRSCQTKKPTQIGSYFNYIGNLILRIVNTDIVFGSLTIKRNITLQILQVFNNNKEKKRNYTQTNYTKNKQKVEENNKA
jgi:hypothetical protein